MKQIDSRICGDIWSSSELRDSHRQLCLKFGGRFSGSDDAAKAARFIKSKFTEYGLDNVRLEPFDMITWQRGSAVLEMISPVERMFPCLALPYAPSCNREFELLDLKMCRAEDVETHADDIPDRAVLVDDRNPSKGPHLHRLQKYLSVLKQGAGAFLFIQNPPGMLAPTGSLAFNHRKPVDQTIPSVGLANETAHEIRYWLDQGPVQLRLRMDNTLVPGADCNVIGELSGDHPAEYLILIGGHYDGHDIAQGAVDNASGVAVVMEIARVLAPFREHLKGRLRFILFGSEEMGLVGSHTHVQKHIDSLSSIRFMFNLDCVGSPGNLLLMMHHASELIQPFSKLAAELPSDMAITENLVPFSDHFPFFLHGVPAAFCCTPGDGGRGWGHTIADTFEKVSQETLQRVAAHLARMVLRVDAMDPWRGRHRTPAEVKKELEPFPVEPLLRYEDHWPFE
ncbi:M28 family peptidase [bacterium]|nr:M28 family peptidase [candidate division CSSED10-310 bacterium]